MLIGGICGVTRSKRLVGIFEYLWRNKLNLAQKKARRKANREAKKKEIQPEDVVDHFEIDEDPSVPPEFKPRRWGKDSDVISSILEEGISNASNYGAKNFEACVCELEGERGPFLVERHDGKGMTSKEIQKFACTPLSSERRGNALNGMGLTSVAAMAGHPASLIVASRDEKGDWAVYEGYADYSEGSHWRTRPRPEFIDKLKKRFGAKELSDHTVFYIYPLQMSMPTSPLGVQNVTNLIFQCPQYIGKGPRARKGYDRNLPKALAIRFDESYIRGTSPLKKDGSHRRALIPREEYFERFCGRSFSFPVEPFDFELKKETGVLARIEKAVVHVHSFPTDKATKKDPGSTGTGWLGSIRDGVKYHFAKGSGSGAGKAPPYKVHLRFPCLNIELSKNGKAIHPFERFEFKAPAFWTDVRSWMQVLGLNCFNMGKKFVVIELEIQEIKKIVRRDDLVNIESFDPMEFAGFFARTPDFTFDERDLCRELSFEICEHVDSSFLTEARSYFSELFPTPEREFFTINLGNESKEPVERHMCFDIFNLATAGKFSRQAVSGDKHRLAIYDRQKRDWVPKCDIKPPSVYESSVKLSDLTSNLEFHETDQKAARHLENERCKDIQIIGVSISKAQRKVKGKWVAFTNIEKQYSNIDPLCCPRRIIILNIRGKDVAICTIGDLPKNKGGSGKKHKKEPRVNDGPAPFQPICNRNEYFIGELKRKDEFLLLNENHPLVVKYFYHTDKAILKYLDPIYWALNTVAHAIREGTNFFKEAPVIPDDETPDFLDGEGYASDKVDFPLSVALRKMLTEDHFIKDAFSKIDKIVEKNTVENSKEEEAA